MLLLSRRLLFRALAAHLLTANTTSAQVRVHRKPKPLPAGAVTHDWPSFLGPSHNGMSTETKLSRTLPPPLVWECPKGTGYASPAIAGNHLVFIHRAGTDEIVECLHPETGTRHWQFRYPTTFEDRYGYNNGPRSSPVIAEKLVYTMGAEGVLHLPGARIRTGGVATRLAGRVQGAAGLLRDRVDAARRRPPADRQRRRAGRAVRGRVRQADGARGLACGDPLGPELRISCSGGRAWRAAGVRVCGRGVQPALRRPDVDRPGNRTHGFRVSVAQPHV